MLVIVLGVATYMAVCIHATRTVRAGTITDEQEWLKENGFCLILWDLISVFDPTQGNE